MTDDFENKNNEYDVYSVSGNDPVSPKPETDGEEAAALGSVFLQVTYFLKRSTDKRQLENI